MTPAPTKATKSIAARKVNSKATKQFAPIAESSDDEDEPLSLKQAQASSRRRLIMEETDSDGVDPPMWR